MRRMSATTSRLELIQTEQAPDNRRLFCVAFILGWLTGQFGLAGIICLLIVSGYFCWPELRYLAVHIITALQNHKHAESDPDSRGH